MAKQSYSQKKRYSHAEMQSWLFQVARRASSDTARDILLKDVRPRKSLTVIGKMYFFKYDPKWKATLPKYDMFPLVFVLEGYPDGFLGLNLHYLSVSERSALIDELWEYANNNKMDDSTKLLISYRRIKAASLVFALARPCVKRYLFTHVRSKFIEVYPAEWDKAAQLNVADFVYAA